MTKSQINYLNMANAVRDVFKTRQSIWQNKVLISDCYDRMVVACTEAGNTSAEQQLNAPGGHTAAKELARTALEDRLFVTGCRLRAFAQTNGDTVAESLASFSRSSLDNLSLNNLLSRARSVAEACTARLQALEPYEVGQADIDALQADIEQVSSLNAHRDATIDQRMENTSHLAGIFTRLRKELKLMDTLVEGYITDEEFLTVYFNARRIHDVKGGSAPKEEKNK